MSNATDKLLERKIVISNIQKYNMYDGPGVRTIVFFQGCPLRCKWCSNPETIERKKRVMCKTNSCADCGACASACPVGVHSISQGTGKHEVDNTMECIDCRRCEEVCTKSAISIAGETKTVQELLEIIEEDRVFYDISGGGITVGGGEPLMQSEGAADLLTVCQNEGFSTAMETSGYARLDAVLRVAPVTDLFLFDIKHMDSDKHYELTGVRNELILENLRELLTRGYNVRIRMPLLKGINDDDQEIQQVIQFLLPFNNCQNFKGVDLLPYHRFGVNKYKQLGKEYPLENYPDPAMSHEDLERVERLFNENNIEVKVVHH